MDRPVKIAPALTRALVDIAGTSSLVAIAAARLLLARELRDARAGNHFKPARSVRAWAAWIGYPVLLPADRVILRDLGAEAVEACAQALRVGPRHRTWSR